MVAHYLKQHKPRAKVLLLDAKDNFSKKALFLQGWKALYGDMVEWVGLADDGRVTRVDAAALEVETAFGQVHKADVLNVIPPQKAGWIAERAGVVDASGWVPVKAERTARWPASMCWATRRSPRPCPSRLCRQCQAKVAAAAIAAELPAGRCLRRPLPTPAAWRRLRHLGGGVYRAEQAS
jgi:hypothetical protein